MALQQRLRRRKQALLHLGRENQRVSNSHQTNHQIKTGINQSQAFRDPGPEKGGGRQQAAFAPPASWSGSSGTARISTPTQEAGTLTPWQPSAVQSPL